MACKIQSVTLVNFIILYYYTALPENTVLKDVCRHKCSKINARKGKLWLAVKFQDNEFFAFILFC
jgi:hypothetical protein